MLRGLWKLTWLETKIFLREPLGVIGSIGFPIVLFVLLRRIGRGTQRATMPPLFAGDLPIMAAVLVAVSVDVGMNGRSLLRVPDCLRQCCDELSWRFGTLLSAWTLYALHTTRSTSTLWGDPDSFCNT